MCRQAEAAVSFGDSPQDVRAQLGAPSSAAPKRSSGAHGGQGAPDFFYAYTDRCLDKRRSETHRNKARDTTCLPCAALPSGDLPSTLD